MFTSRRGLFHDVPQVHEKIGFTSGAHAGIVAVVKVKQKGRGVSSDGTDL
jgi:hypothetical protein